MRAGKVQFVVKVSKLCNLRCRYCYEFKELGNRKRMTLENLESLYHHVAPWFAEQHPSTALEFVWHGGEPLLVPPEFYWRTFEAQKRIFAGRTAALRNVVQTNLTVLDDERVALLRDGFNGVGVSIDLFGGLRVDAGGRDSVRAALSNMDRLRNAKVDFGCITVLTRANLPSVAKIIRFYEKLRVDSVRILPLFDGPFEDQHEGYEITREEVLSGLEAVFEELVALDSGLRVEPIHRYIEQVLHYHTPNAPPSHYDKRAWEPIYIVDTDGDLYSYADDYVPESCHGNLFRTPIRDLLRSPGHLHTIEAGEQRMEAVCNACRFYGSCDGYPMAEEAGRSKKYLGKALECVVAKGMLRYIERRFMELGVIHPVTGAVVIPKPRRGLGVVDRLPLQEDVHVRFRHPELGAVMIIQDISALKQLQHLRQDFMAHVAHDLRTPLQSVLMQLDAIMLRAAGEAASVPISALQLIKRNSQRLDRLIRDLLDASRIDAHGIHLDRVPVSLPELASSIVSQVEGTLGTHSVLVTTTGEPPSVMADPLRVEQMLTNLLENAAKYSAENTPIGILIEPSGQGATVAVQDRGPGISPEEFPLIFDRYYQSKRARALRRGLGLGLYITKGLVEAHGGTIGVKSTPGAGCTFKIWLPAS